MRNYIIVKLVQKVYNSIQRKISVIIVQRVLKGDQVIPAYLCIHEGIKKKNVI